MDQVLTFFRPECKNVLSTVAGDTLNLELSGLVSRTRANLNLDIQSDKVQAKLQTVSDGSTVKIDKTATISLQERCRHPTLPVARAATVAAGAGRCDGKPQSI
jgi:hypothetical protein